MPPPYDIRERSFLFACDIVKFCRKHSGGSSCRRIFDQLLDSGTSVAANAEEAKGACSRKEFAQKNAIALREARETRLWLRIINESTLAPRSEVDSLLRECGELIGIFTAVVRRVRGS